MLHRPPSTASLAGRALLSGVLLSVAWPPTPLAFCLFFALVPWLQGVDAILAAREGRHAMRTVWLFSWLTFLVWNGLTTWWVSIATLPGGIFAVIVNSLLMTLPVLIYVGARRRLGGMASGVALACAWIGFEYLHMRWDLTWPWLTLGNGFAEFPSWVQWYAYTGVLGGSLWVWLVNGMIYRELGRLAEYAIGMEKRFRGSASQRQRLSLILAAVRPTLVIAIPMIISMVWYAKRDPDVGTPVQVALLQTNFDPHSEKFELSSRQILSRMLEASAPALNDSLDYLVWPETALTESIDLGELAVHPSLKRIRKLREDYPRLKVLTGINGFERFASADEAFPAARRFTFGNGKVQWIGGYNAAIQLDASAVTPHYKKGILVPGPECFPFYEQLRWLERWMPSVADYMGRLGRSQERTVFYGSSAEGDTLGAAPAICYESIFGEYMTGWANNGANLFFVITNDGWWRNSPGRKQHMAYARLRAIECRRYVARSANTGISCIINQRGDVVASAGYDNATVLTGTMYANNESTPYMQHGDLLGRTALWIVAGLVLLSLVSWLTGGFLLSRPNAPRPGR